MDAKRKTLMMKFDGILETNADDLLQLDKEQYISALSDEIKYYELESFFAMPKEDGTMISLLKDSHTSTVVEAIAEYEYCLDEPPPVKETNGKETDDSRQARYKFYDTFELNDLLLSGMGAVICTFISIDIV